MLIPHQLFLAFLALLPLFTCLYHPCVLGTFSSRLSPVQRCKDELFLRKLCRILQQLTWSDVSYSALLNPQSVLSLFREIPSFPCPFSLVSPVYFFHFYRNWKNLLMSFGNELLAVSWIVYQVFFFSWMKYYESREEKFHEWQPYVAIVWVLRVYDKNLF